MKSVLIEDAFIKMQSYKNGAICQKVSFFRNAYKSEKYKEYY